MESKIRRSRDVDRVMTVIFYLVAIFFFALLIGFAGKVIIGGLMGAKPDMFRFARKGSIGNQLFNTIYLVFISLLVSIPRRCLRRNLSGHVCETGKNDKVSENVYRDTFFPSVHRCGPVRIPGIPCILRNGERV